MVEEMNFIFLSEKNLLVQQFFFINKTQTRKQSQKILRLFDYQAVELQTNFR